jgi:hypothetical protein
LAGLPTLTSTLSTCGTLLPVCVSVPGLINRSLGDTRFGVGVATKFAKQTKYPCSVATYQHQTDDPAPGRSWTDKERLAVKDGVKAFYETNYHNVAPLVSQNGLVNANVNDLIATILPQDKWDMRACSLISLYAGKVHVSLEFSSLIDFSFLGFHEIHWHFLLLFRTMDTWTSASLKDPSRGGTNL